jgi:hypothetical protein
MPPKDDCEIHPNVEGVTELSWGISRWRATSIADADQVRTIGARLGTLTPDTLFGLHILCAAQMLPVAVRPDVIARASRLAVGQFAQRLRPAVHAGVISEHDIVGYTCPPIVCSAVSLTEGSSEAIASLIAATPDKRTSLRIRAEFCKPSIDETLAEELGNEAEFLFSIGEAMLAAQYLDLAASLSMVHARAGYLIRAANCLIFVGQFSAACVALNEAEPLIVVRALRAELFRQRGRLHTRQGDPYTGSQFEVRAGELLVGHDNPKAAMMFFNAATSLLTTTQTGYARRLAERAVKLSSEGSNERAACEVLLGRLLIANGEVDEAIPYTRLTGAIAELLVTDTSVTRLSEEMDGLLSVHNSTLLALERYEDLREFSLRTRALGEQVAAPGAVEFGDEQLCTVVLGPGSVPNSSQKSSIPFIDFIDF